VPLYLSHPDVGRMLMVDRDEMTTIPTAATNVRE